MTRVLIWTAVALTLAAFSPAYQSSAAAQESGEASAEAAADTSQADAGASAEAQSGDNAAAQGDAQATSNDASNQADSQSASGDASESQPTTTSNDAAATSSTTTSETTDAQNNAGVNNNYQSAQGSAAQPARNDDRAMPAPQQPSAADNQQPRRQDGSLLNRDRADFSTQGRARVDARMRDRDRDYFRRGLQFGIAANRGLAISQIEQDSIYYRSGFRRGDVIISLYGRPVRSQDDFYRFIVMQPGQRVPVVVLRDGRQQTIYVDYPQELVQTNRIYDNRVPQAGGAYLGVLFDTRVRDAAIVVNVSSGSPAEEAGLQPGDTILAMNGREIGPYPQAIATIRSMQPGQELEIVVGRGQSEAQLVAVLGAQGNVRTATRPAEVQVQPVPVEPQPGVQIEVNPPRGRLFNRDRNNDGVPDRPLLRPFRN